MAPAELDPATFDRTDFSPLHEGPNILPHDLIFHRLHFLATNQPSIAVKDAHKGHEITYSQLLSHIIQTRNHIGENLSGRTTQMLRNGEEVSLMIVARGYEFVVSFFAVLALGGIVVPQSPHISLEELLHAAKTCRAHAALSSDEYLELTRSIANKPETSKEYRPITITSCITKKFFDLSTVIFSSSKVLDVNKPGLLIFTSGSTGPPKGAAIRRFNIYAIAQAQCWKNNIKEGFVVLQTLPTHHATGLMLNTVPTIIGGGCVEFTDPKFDAGALWDRIRLGGITSLSAVPTVFVRLLQHWDKVIQTLPLGEREVYRKALCDVEQYHCGSAALPVPIARKWSQLCDGRHILERYGGTEFGNPYLNLKEMPFAPGSVGVKNPGTESYLENGDQGEVFVRTPFMFSKYIYDIEGTQKSLTVEGFFKTGDVAEKVGGVYFLKGRKSIDIIKSGGYKISALDVEREILSHPKIQEAIVIGVDDPEYGQRIATAVVLQQDGDSLTLAELRNDMRERLSYYKLPTILRVVSELKKTASFKVPKLLLKKELFETGHQDIQRWGQSKAKL